MKVFQFLLFALLPCTVFAANPVFLITPTTPVIIIVPPDETATASYTVTNNTPYTLVNNGLRLASQGGQTLAGVTQVTGGAGVCTSPFTLAAGASCTLNLLINGADVVNGQAIGGPEICNTLANPVHCSIPASGNQLNVTVTHILPTFSITPNPPIITSVPAQGTAMASYTVTNTSPYTTYNNGVLYVSDGGQTPAGVTQVTGGAGVCSDPFTLAAGASCTLNLLITGANLVDGQAVGGPEICNTEANPLYCSVPTSGNQLDIIAIGFPLSLGVGQDFTTELPYFVLTPNGGNNWFVGPVPFGAPLVPFLSSACASSICLIVGGDQSFTPYAIYTLDANTWTPLSSYLFDAITLYGASCVSGFCVAVGQGDTSSFLIQTQDNGASWQPITQPDTDGTYFNVSCSDSICVAAGSTPGPVPLLVYSQAPLGNSWSTPSSPPLPATGQFGQFQFGVSTPDAVSCSGLVCIAVGYDNITGTSIIMRTSDGGNTWFNTVPMVGGGDFDLTTYIFYSVSCSGPFCVIAGFDINVSGSLLMLSIDSGNTWTINSQVTQSDYYYSNVSCSADVCVATGYSFVAQVFFMAQSSSPGNLWTWSFVDNTFTPVNSYFSTVDCDEQFCIVAGGTSTFGHPGPPVLAQTQNAGGSWCNLTDSSCTAFNGTLPAVGVFFGSTASGALKDFNNDLFYFKHKGLKF